MIDTETQKRWDQEDAATRCTLYVAGPMTGHPQFNIPAFDDAAEDLRDLGHFVVSPAELDNPETREACLASKTGDQADVRTGDTWGDFLSRDVKLLADGYAGTCAHGLIPIDGVAVLPGWHESKGARLEVHVARQLGKPIFIYNWLAAHDDAWGLPEPGAGLLVSPDWLLIEMDDEELDYWMAKGDPKVVAKIARDEATPPTLSDEPNVPDTDFTGVSGEVRITSDTGGEKGRKPERMELIPPEFLWELGRVYGMGAEKYDDHNYLKGYDWGLSFGALLRHVTQAQAGEWRDEESGLPHLAHAAWHCAALLMFEKHGLGNDDRICHVVEASEKITATGRSEAARKDDA